MGEVCAQAMRDMAYRGARRRIGIPPRGKTANSTSSKNEHPPRCRSQTPRVHRKAINRASIWCAKQIRIAEGKPLSVTQDELEFKGHAIECRINAEDPFNFAPSPGLVTYYHAAGGMHVRVDSGLYAGYRIPLLLRTA